MGGTRTQVFCTVVSSSDLVVSEHILSLPVDSITCEAVAMSCNKLQFDRLH